MHGWADTWVDGWLHGQINRLILPGPTFLPVTALSLSFLYIPTSQNVCSSISPLPNQSAALSNTAFGTSLPLDFPETISERVGKHPSGPVLQDPWSHTTKPLPLLSFRDVLSHQVGHGSVLPRPHSSEFASLLPSSARAVGLLTVTGTLPGGATAR